MRYLFTHHNVLPSQFMQIPAGERVVLYALAVLELEAQQGR